MSYRFLLLMAIPLLFRPPISPPLPPPLTLLELLIVALHPLPLLLFLIVVLHLVVVVVVILLLSLHHHLAVKVLLFVMGSNGPSCVASTYSHPVAAAPPLVVDCCVAS